MNISKTVFAVKLKGSPEKIIILNNIIRVAFIKTVFRPNGTFVALSARLMFF